MILAVFLDLRKAFETIDREVLLLKLKKYGIKNEVFNWFKTWFTNRTQETKFNSETFQNISVKIGIFQGNP